MKKEKVTFLIHLHPPPSVCPHPHLVSYSFNIVLLPLHNTYILLLCLTPSLFPSGVVVVFFSCISLISYLLIPPSPLPPLFWFLFLHLLLLNTFYSTFPFPFLLISPSFSASNTCVSS